MKYNPVTKQLYTDEGAFLKKLYCPVVKQWDDLSATNSLKVKLCDHCQTTVLDTALLSDAELQIIVAEQPHKCLKVDLNQPNLTITYNER